MTMRCIFSLLLLLFGADFLEPALAQTSANRAAISAATSPLPPEYRDSAEVRVYNEGGALVTARAGTNGMICLADQPGDDLFHVACYHSSLEPFMERGRELRAQGLEREALEQTREKEAIAGKLRMPDQPAALYSLSGPPDVYDSETGEVSGATPLHVVYLPWATAEQTGLPTSAPRGMPWIMDSGKPWAHIMLLPQPSAEED